MLLNKRHKSLIYIIILSVSLFVAGPLSWAAAEADPDAGDQAPARTDPYARVDLTGLSDACFYKRSANNWTVLDRTRLIVYEAGKSRPFLVEISPPSFRLRSATTIGFVSNNSRVCGYAGERVIIDEGAGKAFFITKITRLDAERRDELLAVRKEIRAAAKDSPKDKSEPAADKKEAEK